MSKELTALSPLQSRPKSIVQEYIAKQKITSKNNESRDTVVVKFSSAIKRFASEFSFDIGSTISQLTIGSKESSDSFITKPFKKLQNSAYQALRRRPRTKQSKRYQKYSQDLEQRKSNYYEKLRAEKNLEQKKLEAQRLKAKEQEIQMEKIASAKKPKEIKAKRTSKRISSYLMMIAQQYNIDPHEFNNNRDLLMAIVKRGGHYTKIRENLGNQGIDISNVINKLFNSGKMHLMGQALEIGLASHSSTTAEAFVNQHINQDRIIA